MRYYRIQTAARVGYYQLLYGMDDLKPEEDCAVSFDYTMDDLAAIFFHNGTFIGELDNCSRDVMIRRLIN